MIISEFLKDHTAVRISKRLLLDPGLTEIAKCTACVLIALPPERCPSGRRLAEIMHTNKNAVARALRQLENAGYLARFPHHEGGRSRGTSYIIYNSPEDNPKFHR